ncbi:MAG: hypothetical protein H6707_06025 [Deltaproteobacteria bacterium]|nr:hypothetical protein [Deltaproteobacteria bacterium]
MPARFYLLTICLSTTIGTLPAAAQSAKTAGEATEQQPKAVLPHVQFKPGKGLSIQSADQRFKLSTKLRVQMLYSLSKDHADSDNAEHSLMLRRARVSFGGHAFNAHNRFEVQLAVSPRDLSQSATGPRHTPVLDWMLIFDYLRDLSLRVGQAKVPYSIERLTSSGSLQMVDRSSVNSEFNLDRDIGVSLFSEDLFGLGLLRYFLYLGVGEGRDAFAADDFGMLYSARVELFPLGLFKNTAQTDFERGPARLAIGLAYALHDNAKRNRGIIGDGFADGGTADLHNATVDVMFIWRGFSLLGAFMWRGERARKSGGAIDQTTGDPVALENVREGTGWVAQAGYLLGALPLEFATRFAAVRGATDSSLSKKNEVGGAVSYYFFKHAMKMQLDYFRTWGSSGIDNGADQLRVQLQLAL